MRIEESYKGIHCRDLKELFFNPEALKKMAKKLGKKAVGLEDIISQQTSKDQIVRTKYQRFKMPLFQNDRDNIKE